MYTGVVGGNVVDWVDPMYGLGPVSSGGSLTIWHAVDSGSPSSLLAEGSGATGLPAISLLAMVE